MRRPSSFRKAPLHDNPNQIVLGKKGVKPPRGGRRHGKERRESPQKKPVSNMNAKFLFHQRRRFSTAPIFPPGAADMIYPGGEAEIYLSYNDPPITVSHPISCETRKYDMQQCSIYMACGGGKCFKNTDSSIAYYIIINFFLMEFSGSPIAVCSNPRRINKV